MKLCERRAADVFAKKFKGSSFERFQCTLSQSVFVLCASFVSLPVCQTVVSALLCLSRTTATSQPDRQAVTPVLVFQNNAICRVASLSMSMKTPWFTAKLTFITTIYIVLKQKNREVRYYQRPEKVL